MVQDRRDLTITKPKQNVLWRAVCYSYVTMVQNHFEVCFLEEAFLCKAHLCWLIWWRISNNQFSTCRASFFKYLLLYSLIASVGCSLSSVLHSEFVQQRNVAVPVLTAVGCTCDWRSGDPLDLYLWKLNLLSLVHCLIAMWFLCLLQVVCVSLSMCFSVWRCVVVYVCEDV